jgi:sec-independent protein translocase protein TatC
MENFEQKIDNYLPHLEELRKRIYRSTIFFSLTFILGFFCSNAIVEKFVKFFGVSKVTIATSSPFQFVNLAVDIGLIVAILLTTPFLILNLFFFVKESLTKKERRGLYASMFICLFLLILGFSYGFSVLYYAFDVLAVVNENLGIKNIWDVELFFSQIFLTSSLLGLIFQYPIVLTILIKTGVIDTNFLRKKRRLAVFFAVLLVSLLPPTDGISLLLMAFPLVAMYELTILLNFNSKKICLDLEQEN